MIVNKEKNFISAVVYVHNNEEHIGYFLKNLYSEMENHFEKFEIIFVNDYSIDKSVEIIREFGEKVKGSVISIINMCYFQGLELSMNAGIDLAIGDFVYEFDTMMIDYELSTIMQVYQTSMNGFDIVSAALNTRNNRPSNLFYLLFNANANNPYKIQTESFRIISRRAINRVHAMSKTIPYRKALYASSGLKLERILYTPVEQMRFKSTKQISENRREVAVDSLILFTDVAYKLSITMTFLMMGIAILVGIYTVYMFLSAAPVAGWTTTMIFLSFGFFGVFAIMAIIIKYLSILINLSFKVQKYKIESIEKITKN